MSEAFQLFRWVVYGALLTRIKECNFLSRRFVHKARVNFALTFQSLLLGRKVNQGVRCYIRHALTLTFG